MENIYIKNKKELEDKILILKQDGIKNIHIISDFDRTMTKAFFNSNKNQSTNKKVNTSFSKIRDGGYLSPEYKKRAYELFDIYYPIEQDPKISLAVKMKKMDEWWNKHLQLMIDSGLNKKILHEVANNGELLPREGLFKLMDLLKKNKVPLLILSAGLGDVIKEYLNSVNKLSENVHLISNFYEFNEQNKVIGYKTKPIHSFNKNEIEVKGHKYYHEIKERKNVLLLGDSISDVNMADGLKHNCVIKIGFLNDNIYQNIEEYSNAYDVLILNDGNMDYIINLINKISPNNTKE
jgi:cytosolic 5'-nucleotidase 3